MEVIEITNNQKAEDVVNEKLAQFVEEVARLYGVKIHVEDTDWQVIYDLRVNLHEALEKLGVKLIQHD